VRLSSLVSSSAVSPVVSRQYSRLFVGFVLGWFVLDRVATRMHSLYGEAGSFVAAATVSLLILVEMALFGEAPKAIPRVLGLTLPAARGLGVAVALSLPLLAFYPIFAAVTDSELVLRPGWLWLLPGLFLQGGVAEETLFRGYLFGHLRRTRPFWRAALLSMPPFLVVHLMMFTYMDAAVATAATLLAISISFPLARLYDLAGRTIWAPAIVHFVIQGSVKVIVPAEGKQMALGIAWMALCLVVPWVVFALPKSRQNSV